MNYTEMKELQSFGSIEEMNKAVRGFLYAHKHELTASAVSVIKIVSRYACKIVGVAFLKVNTIARLIGISERTVQRALKLLVSFGVIERKSTIRKQGGSGHNVYVIRNVTADVVPPVSPRQEAEKPAIPSVEQPKVDSETVTLETSSSKRNKKRINVSELDESFTPSNVPQEFIETAAPFYRSANAIYKLWNRVLVAYKKSGMSKPVEESAVLSDVIKAFKESVFAKKSNRIRSTFEGYFYSVVAAKLAVWKRREVPLFDWLNIV